MGIPIKGDINLVSFETIPQDLGSFENYLKDKKIVVLDDRFGKNYFPVLSGLKIRDKDLIPTVIYKSTEAGGGGGEGFSLYYLFGNPSSNLYLPSILINGILMPIFTGAIIKLLSNLIQRFRKTDKDKRIQIIYMFSQRAVQFFEFPPEIKLEEVKKGLRSIPSFSLKNKKRKYFRRTNDNKWISENPN